MIKKILKLFILITILFFYRNTYAKIIENVLFKSQVPPGSWSRTLNCGQTSVIIANSYYNNSSISEEDIKNIDIWLNEKFSDPIRDFNGYYTNTTKLKTLCSDYFDMDYCTINSGENLFSFLKEQINLGNLSILQVRVKMKLTKVPHFMVFLGYDNDFVYFHDPGQSKGSYVKFKIQDFLEVWENQNFNYLLFQKNKKEDKEDEVVNFLKIKEVNAKENKNLENNIIIDENNDENIENNDEIDDAIIDNENNNVGANNVSPINENDSNANNEDDDENIENDDDVGANIVRPIDENNLDNNVGANIVRPIDEHDLDDNSEQEEEYGYITNENILVLGPYLKIDLNPHHASTSTPKVDVEENGVLPIDDENNDNNDEDENDDNNSDENTENTDDNNDENTENIENDENNDNDNNDENIENNDNDNNDENIENDDNNNNDENNDDDENDDNNNDENDENIENDDNNNNDENTENTDDNNDENTENIVNDENNNNDENNDDDENDENENDGNDEADENEESLEVNNLFGELNSDITLTPEIPYTINSEFIVPQNVILTILPGVKILFGVNGSLIVEGKIESLGSSQNKIIFTTSKTENPVENSWKWIKIKNSGEAVFNWTIIEYGGYDYLSGEKRAPIIIDGGYLDADNLYIKNIDNDCIKANFSYLNIKNSSFKNCRYGLNLTNSEGIIKDSLFLENFNGFVINNSFSDLILKNNSINNSLDYSIKLINSVPMIIDMNYSDNKYDEIFLDLNLDFGDYVLSKGIYYVLKVNLSENTNFTISPGCVFKSYNSGYFSGSWYVRSNIFNAVGMENSPIIFDSYYENPELNQRWGKINFYNNNFLNAENVIIKNGGRNYFLGEKGFPIYLENVKNINALNIYLYNNFENDYFYKNNLEEYTYNLNNIYINDEEI
ncbi:hypothetical protein K9M42_01250 [Patescibacteria group bacterium]|nr:hypothetical protein [Patescibacteria group bacterium]